MKGWLLKLLLAASASGTVFCLAAVVADVPIDQLVGAQGSLADCKNCHDATPYEQGECYHEKAGDTCRTDACILNRVYQIECTKKAPSEKASCKYVFDPNLLVVEQERYFGVGPFDCSKNPGPGFTPLPGVPSGAANCIPPGGAAGRCFIAGCAGSVGSNSYRNGRNKCN